MNPTRMAWGSVGKTRLSLFLSGRVCHQTGEILGKNDRVGLKLRQEREFETFWRGFRALIAIRKHYIAVRSHYTAVRNRYIAIRNRCDPIRRHCDGIRRRGDTIRND